jgi:hypothetical protein
MLLPSACYQWLCILFFTERPRFVHKSACLRNEGKSGFGKCIIVAVCYVYSGQPVSHSALGGTKSALCAPLCAMFAQASRGRAPKWGYIWPVSTSGSGLVHRTHPSCARFHAWVERRVSRAVAAVIVFRITPRRALSCARQTLTISEESARHGVIRHPIASTTAERASGAHGTPMEFPARLRAFVKETR